MKNISILGAILVVLGVCALFFGHISYTETKPAVRLGPLQIDTQEDHTLWIPTVAGAITVIAGLGLVMAGRRSS